ncbi:unnamed protein product [Anisakis simplex]|uniref:NEDD8-activating enzyme E1 regulatory subunit n=1 Tax=Anisakis simplex TaxID=6269 RepID=A0A0M3JWE8_ANISI|nr:unnamed protein product [Anisakis simplex]
MQTVRYDRQIRLWGDQGQSSIESASVCMIGSSALSTEILKSLILAGIKSVFVIDSTFVTNPDVGNNFFIEQQQLGQMRAKVTTEWLKELNASVRCEYDTRSVEQLVEDGHLEMLKRFAIVIATNLRERDAIVISDFLFDCNIPFLHARVFGFVGYIRICVKEHTIMNSHSENVQPDVRLDAPFAELEEMVDAIDLEALNYEEHSHIPYLLLYLKALKIWRQEVVHDKEAFPDEYKKRKSYESVLMSLRRANPETHSLDEENFIEGRNALARSMRSTTIPSNVHELFKNERCERLDESSSFWLLVSALKRFVLSEKVMPVTGQLPDMVSDSQRYIAIASLYRKYANSHAEKVFGYLQEILKERGLSRDLIAFSECEFFCRNASMISVQHGTTISQEIESKLENILCDIRNADLTPNPITGVPQIPPAIWYILLRAVDRFHSEKGRYPGTNGVPCTIDSHDLKSRVVGLITDCQVVDVNEVLEKIRENVIDEMCRYGCAELHVIASLIGGIASQEAIKLITHQYIPVNNTLIFDAHTQNSNTYQL